MVSLPPELLSEILLLALPHSDPSYFSESSYRTRLSLLSNFALVSRLFKGIADPILYSIFWARNPRQLQSFIAAIEYKENAQDVKRLVLYFPSMGANSISQAQVLLAAKTLPHVKQLSLYNASIEDLSVLNKFSELESLVLEEVDHKTRSCFILPSLKQLTVRKHCSIELSEIKDENAPNLSALALQRKTKLGDWYPPLSSTTPWNLDAFVLDWNWAYNWQGDLPNVLVDILFTGYRSEFETTSIIRSGIRHMRVCYFSSAYYNSYEQDLVNILQIVREKPRALQTLILPPRLASKRLSNAKAQSRDKVKTLAAELVEECMARNIELIFEKSPGKLDSRVSKAFLEKMERLARARREAEQGEEEEEEK
ncbi:hypothetical protein JCM3765_005014 [Sporobolomyces pararoseus]